MNAETQTSELVNVLVDLADERFGEVALQAAIGAAKAAGFELEHCEPVPERRLSWIDLAFGGTWSSEVAAGSAWFGLRDGEPVGVAAYDARGLRFYWLRAWENERDVGLFGPCGVVARYANSPLRHALLLAGLCSLRDRGFVHALIPALTGESTVAYYQTLTGGRIVERHSMARIAPNIRTTVLASGGGSNFQAVIDALPDGLGLELRALISNRADAFALERAKRNGIPAHVLPWNREKVSRAAYDAELTELVMRTDPELILLLGWMHVLPPSFVERFETMINIHPAFLPHDGRAESVTMPDGAVIPAFRGAHAIRDALAAGSAWYGATAHRVEADFDRGAVMTRAPLRLSEKSEVSALAALRPTEHGVLIGAIRRFLSER